MKKLFSTVALSAMLLALTNSPVFAYTEVVYLHHTFEGAATLAIVDGKYVITPDSTKDKGGGVWQASNSANPTYTLVAAGTETANEANPAATNPTAYMKSNAKGAAFNFTNQLSEPVTGEANILYVDIRIKREYVFDNCEFKYYDSSGKTLFTFMMPNGGSTNSGIYINSNTSLIPDTTDYNSLASDWFYLRTIFNFNTKGLQVFLGPDINTLQPYTAANAYTFHDTSATNFSKIILGTNKGGFSFDDIKVYALQGVPAPHATVSMTGKPHLGTDLIGTYESYEELVVSEDEGSSYCYWERADNPGFAGAVKITNDTQIDVAGKNTYKITEDDTGMYVRFCLVPKSQTGVAGAVAVSSATLQINTVQIAVQGAGEDGDTNGYKGSNFENKGGKYRGKASITNTTLESKKYLLVNAFYSNGVLFGCNTAIVDVPAGNTNETTGQTSTIAYTENTDISSYFSAGTIGNVTQKVFLLDWKATPSLKPAITSWAFGKAF